MDINEKDYSQKSPYADSPYESAYIEPRAQAGEMIETPKPEKRKRSWKPLVAGLLLVVCCAATAFGVDCAWRGRFDRMEAAVEEKFEALEELYSQSQNQQQDSQLPEQGPLTPAQVYAQNVQSVVAVVARLNNGEGFGSGFVISADGYVVTNYHVIAGATQVTVTLYNDEVLQAEIIGHDEANDIALLKVEGENLLYAKLGSSDALVVGDRVAAIGNPLGELTATLTVGYISAKDRVVDTDGTVINMLQTDAAINAGNSGGPLFNMNGEAVGIITAKYSGNSSGTSIEGLGFAIPVDDVFGVLSDLKEFGYVTGAHLGVYVRDVEASVQPYGLPAGAYVEEVTEDGAAYRAGIRTGDIIVNLGGYDVDSVATLTRALRRFEAGETISVTVFRKGNQEYLSVTLDKKPIKQTPEINEPEQENDYFDKFYDFFWPFFGN